MEREQARDRAILECIDAIDGLPKGNQCIRPLIALYNAGHAAGQQQWVDVADRQPDSDGWYLIVADFGNGYESAKKRYAIEVDGTGYWICSGATVVAWMPIPEYQHPSAVEGDKSDEIE